MTTTPGDLQRKVRQMENDVLAIYEMFTSLSAQQRLQGNRLDSLEARFDSVDARFDGVDARFDAVDARFDAMDARFDEVLALLRA